MDRLIWRLLFCMAVVFHPTIESNAEDLIGSAIGGIVIGVVQKPLDPKNLSRRKATQERLHRQIQATQDPQDRQQRERVAAVQQALQHFGFDPGIADGRMGPRTGRAIARYQTSIGKPATGSLTDDEILLLVGTYSASLANEIEPSLLGHERSATGLTLGSRETGGLVKISWSRADIYASRLFAGPEDYPPSDFAAYGILAFTSRATPRDRDRHLMICQAYVSSIRSFNQIAKPAMEQMVTVWPIENASVAASLMQLPEDEVCVSAVENYGSVTADRALRHASIAGAELNGLGPFLIAWSPPAKKGENDAVVLVADLSEVNDYSNALNVMIQWVQDIERDPEVWTKGWNRKSLNEKLQRWFDHRGTLLLKVFSGS